MLVHEDSNGRNTIHDIYYFTASCERLATYGTIYLWLLQLRWLSSMNIRVDLRPSYRRPYLVHEVEACGSSLSVDHIWKMKHWNQQLHSSSWYFSGVFEHTKFASDREVVMSSNSIWQILFIWYWPMQICLKRARKILLVNVPFTCWCGHCCSWREPLPPKCTTCEASYSWGQWLTPGALLNDLESRLAYSNCF